LEKGANNNGNLQKSIEMTNLNKDKIQLKIRNMQSMLDNAKNKVKTDYTKGK